MPATKLIDGTQQVPSPGTAVRLAEQASDAITSIAVQALGTNTGTIVVGASDVVAAPGTHASPTQKGIAITAGQVLSINTSDVGGVYIDATVANDGVSWIATQLN